MNIVSHDLASPHVKHIPYFNKANSLFFPTDTCNTRHEDKHMSTRHEDKHMSICLAP